jgi:hypothetical protein
VGHAYDGCFGCVICEAHGDVDGAGAGGDVDYAAVAAGAHGGEDEVGCY